MDQIGYDELLKRREGNVRSLVANDDNDDGGGFVYKHSKKGARKEVPSRDNNEVDGVKTLLVL